MEKDGRGENGTFWQEQQETVEEEAMRKRKDALGSLFSEWTVRLVTDFRSNRGETASVQCLVDGPKEE